MPKPAVRRDRTLNDIRYFESTYLPSEDLPSPHYIGRLFAASPTSTSFGQLIGSKCAEASVTIRGGSALYVMFTTALPPGEMQRLTFQTEVWQTWLAVGWDLADNACSDDERAARIRQATFAALQFLAPDCLEKLHGIEAQYREKGPELRVRCTEKTARGYRISVLTELLPRGQTSHLWLEVENLKSGARAEHCLTPLASSTDGPFLAQRITTTADTLTIHPYASDNARYYVEKYNTPFVIRTDALAWHGG